MATSASSSLQAALWCLRRFSGLLLLLPCHFSGVSSFSVLSPPSVLRSFSSTRKSPLLPLASTSTPPNSSHNKKREPSRVTDEDGVTPEFPVEEIEEVYDLPELREIEDASQMPPGPIPHQPWRRGETNGCEDPITVEWRREAEDVMTKATQIVGGKVVDITWYLTQVVVTLDPEWISNAHDILKASGPVIEVAEPSDPIYYDPNDPKPEEILVDNEVDDIVYQRETEEEAEERIERKRTMYAKKDESDPKDEPHIPDAESGDDDDEQKIPPLYMNEETRADTAYTDAVEVKARYDELERPVPKGAQLVDKNALSIIAGAMIEALEEVEPQLRILSRHELVLTSPGPKDVLETQKQFDAHRGEPVIVETQDPWQSNRVLKGRLLDRNSMDVLINKQGRMVTVPLNFVKCVRIEPPAPSDDEQLTMEEEEETNFE